jgi:hypothetical protein
MRGGGWYHNSVKTTIFNNSVNSPAHQAFNSGDEAYWLYKINAPMTRVDFLKEKAWDEAIMAAARKWAKISLRHEVQLDNAHRMKHV